MSSLIDMKKQICDVGRRMYEQGFVAANDGNISVRMGDGRYLCTPTGVSKGSLKPEHIAIVDDKGKQLSGPLPRTSEIMLHLEIYHEMPSINAVCHAHPPHATAFAVAHVNLPEAILPEVEIFIGHVPLAAYDTPGSKQFAETILPHLRNKANTILLANHGAVSCDRSLEQAYFHLETLDMYCKILLLSKQIGSVQQISEPKVRELLEIKQRLGIDDPRLEGSPAQAAVLAGSDEFLRGFSSRPIPHHQADSNGHGRGSGIANLPSQCGQPQPAVGTAVVAGRKLGAPSGLGSSSSTARQRAAEDQIEQLVQLITDRIVQASGTRD